MASTSPWVCPDCRHANAAQALLCDFCGLAWRSVSDPGLDMPYRPAPAATEAFFAVVLWGALSAGGLLLLLAPGWREALGLSPAFVLVELVLALWALASAAVSLVWERLFYRLEVDAPRAVRTAEPFTVTVTLVPYLTLEGVSVRAELVDRFYAKDRRGRTALRMERHDEQLMAENLTLRARRAAVFQASFLGPAPLTKHSDVKSELAADLFGLVGFVLPAAAQHARNLREHGGYYVRVVVRVGLLRRSVERRVVSVLLGNKILFG